MSRRWWARARWLVFLVGALAIAATVAWFVHTPAVPGVPPALVPPQWAEVRTSVGHEAHVGAKDVTCKDCHAYEDGGFHAPPADVCGKCHADQTLRGHGGGDAKATACLECHPFAARKTVPTCIGCHANARGEHAAIATHATADCRACHTPHGSPATTPKDCAACHEERAPNHAAHDGSKGCADCHQPHQPAVAAKAACATCHAQAARPHPETHTCDGCHKTHELRATVAVCNECHAGKPTLGARAGGPKEHAVCTSCHDPHSPMSDPKASCAKCHSDVAVQHGGGGQCVACHAPHGGSSGHGASALTATIGGPGSHAAVPRAVACTSCHSKVAVGDVAHAAGTPCTKCHQQHAFSPPTDRLAPCARCHARETALAAGGMGGLLAAPRPPGQGHRGCTSCHGANAAHAPQAAPACATCHEPEATTAPSGHAKCQGCHETHSGKLAGTIQATCTSCHAPEAGTPHGKAPGGCIGCHRPHGPNGVATPPTCTTCHAKPGAPLPGLHAEPKHGTCASCHTSHAPTKADRATCTNGCHQDRVGHQPAAAVCNGCHVFR
jgi:hypothetical protein